MVVVTEQESPARESRVSAVYRSPSTMTTAHNVNSNIEMPVGFYHLFEQIGSGGYANVYRGMSFIGGAEKVVAVKQSRAPLRLKRPMLQHEARVLQLLQGHPTIPQVYAYGHLTHFEFLAIELLGPTLYDLKDKEGRFSLKRVAQIAVQMVSGLNHIHDRGIVHRDIKPSNILVSLNNPDHVCLADFGIATPLQSGIHNKQASVKEKIPFIGSLIWASLNSHEGHDLSARDDLESLAYTLLGLILDSLPWQRYDNHLSPIFRRSAHVKKKKLGWNGSRFAFGSVTEFGELLDYARSLKFNDRPDYDFWYRAFNGIPESCGQVEGDASMKPRILPSSKTCIVRPGQLVFVQVLAEATIEGYVNDVDDLSYWHDPELGTEDWVTKFRPAIVLDTNTWDETYHTIRVLPIRREESTQNVVPKNLVRIINQRYAVGNEGIVVLDWPLDGTFCYSFPDTEVFVPVPRVFDQVPAFWEVCERDLKMLTERFSRRVCLSKSDAFLWQQMGHRCSRIYVDIKPMLPETLHVKFGSIEVDWKGKRGWFDELVKINKKASADGGDPWPGMGPSVVKRNEWHDSYSGSDISEWDNEQDDERSCSLMLPPGLEENLDKALEQIKGVDKGSGGRRKLYRVEPQSSIGPKL